MKYDLLETGIRIKEIRKTRGITQEQLADILHVSREHIGRIERGKGGASIEVFADIACKFDLSLDYLVLGKEDSNSTEPKDVIKNAIDLLTKIHKEL